MSRIEFKNISFAFETEEIKRSLFFDNLSQAFSFGHIGFIEGKNGSGKSTLFRIMRGLIYPEEHITGTLSLGKQTYDLTDPDHRELLLHTVKLVAQKFDTMLADQFTFTENLQIANIPHIPRLAPLPTGYSIPPLVKRFGIDMNSPVSLLSGGQRQILAILMALQKETKLLLLDEPTAALDPKNSRMVMEFLHDLVSSRPDLTILIICHDKELVETYGHDYYYHLAVSDHGDRSLVRKNITERK